MRVLQMLRRFIADFGISFTACSIFSYLRRFAFSGFTQTEHWKISVLDGFYFALICYVLFSISIRWLSSTTILAILSWLAVGALFYANLAGAQDMGLTLRVGGHDIYVSGDITPYGMLHALFDPVLALALVATAVAAFKRIRARKDKISS